MSANAGEFSGPEMERIDDVKRRRIASEVFSRVAMPPAAAGGRSETVLVFASSKHRAEQFHAALTESLAAAVSEAGGAPREWECAVMSASFSLETKAQMMARFIAGQPGPEGKPCVRVMVATANMSRGGDFPNVTLVIHADFPDNAADYLHRSGRTGRARNTGEGEQARRDDPSVGSLPFLLLANPPPFVNTF
ncbi:MAG: P-loop containing nucleoside triphosphate hydrolase protein [Olpidium bornovanus]|uniref:RNA helicase n=1 Tax=Olpidium bornovanus TaxID=278681 RepID=A0A8H8A0C8_9FUNG|nr:MAG: P-loop containing nucleoside triphosphate hydrolase protein [Olpidium bornovanus]